MHFQTGKKIDFDRNNKFLEKAKDAQQPLLTETVVPQKLVTVTKGKGIDDITIKASNQKLENLSHIKLGKGDSIILDLGNHHVGYFSVEISSVGSPMDAPLFLHLVFAEQPVEFVKIKEPYDGALSKSWLQEDYVHVDQLPTVLKLNRRYSCRYIKLEVIDTSPKWKIVFHNPTFEAKSAVSLANVTTFKTNDDQLNKIIAVSAKTLQDCMQDVFEDGPKRDRRLWLGDLRLQALANYASFNDQNLVKRCLYLFGALPTSSGRITSNLFTGSEPIPDDTFLYDYGLFFISTLYDYYQQYHDKETVKDLFLPAKRELAQALLYLNKQNLVELKSDWPIYVDSGNNFDKSTCATAILIYALKQFISLGQVVNEDMTDYTNKLQDIVEAALNNLYDKKTGFFVSGKNKEINVASQVWMVLAHILTDEENQQLMAASMKKFYPFKDITTPYMYHHIAAALFESGNNELAIKLIKKYWGSMLDLGADTFWEAFKPDDLDFSPYNNLAINSYCHAWSCTPIYLLKKYYK